MITVGMNYEVKEGKGTLFESVFYKVLDVMNGMDGHERSNLFRDVQNPNAYLIVSAWSDRAAFDGFIASDRFRNVADWGKEEVLASRPHHDIYEHAAPAPAAPAVAPKSEGAQPPPGCPMHRPS